MTFTGRIGSTDSRLGNIVLGLGAARGRRFSRSARTPFYRVQVFDFADSTNFGVGALIAEFDRFKALGHADFANSVPEAFFTIMQDDPKVKALRGKGGKAHVRIWRGDDLVWTGWTSLERDATSSDAIFYCYGYLAGLYWLHTQWQSVFTAKTVGYIADVLWTRAKTTLTQSRVGFVTTGSIEEPPTVAGGSTAITLPVYESYYKRLLFGMQEMAAISASDTGNSTIFEITHALTPRFNFWKNRKRTLTTVRWAWGDGKVQGFREYGMPVYHRNHIYAVGQQPRDLILRKEVTDAADITAWGRMEESLFLAWVRDESELERVTKLRAAKAKREDLELMLDFYPGAETPPGTATSQWRIGDVVPVKIDRGVTLINGNFQITGYMVAVLNGQEKVNVMIQAPV